MSRIQFLSLITAMMLSIPVAFAHMGGISLQKDIGEYIIDVDFSVFQIVSGEEMLISTAMITNEPWPNWDFPQFDKTEVTIRNADDTAVLEKTFELEQPDFAFTPFTFPQDGKYEMTVKFYNKNVSIGEGVFSVPVPSQQIGTAPVASLGGMGIADVGFGAFIILEVLLAVGAGIVFLVRRHKRHR